MDFLNHPETLRIIENALREDIGPGDYTTLSTVPAGKQARARCLIKDTGMLAGVALAAKVFAQVDPELTLEVLIEDGAWVVPGDIAFYVAGDPRSILQSERIVLNCMQRMSGIATLSHAAMQEMAGTACKVLDTRKTTPGIRHLEKWSVHIGGAQNHRFGLYDMVMIKDNHIEYAGSIPAAVNACVQYLDSHGLDLNIEVETRNLDEVAQAVSLPRVTHILLDNMSLETMREAVSLVAGKAKTEASGNMRIGHLRPVAETGVDYISIGALTHSVRSLDISLKACE